MKNGNKQFLLIWVESLVVDDVVDPRHREHRSTGAISKAGELAACWLSIIVQHVLNTLFVACCEDPSYCITRIVMDVLL